MSDEAGDTACKPTKQTMSTPMVAIHCGLRSRASVLGRTAGRTRGNSHMLHVMAAYATQIAATRIGGRLPNALLITTDSTRARPSVARALRNAP